MGNMTSKTVMKHIVFHLSYDLNGFYPISLQKTVKYQFMDKKERYLALSKEIISGKNPENRKIAPEETYVLNFIKGVRSINRQDHYRF